MKRSMIIAAISLGLVCAQANAADALTTDKDKLSYAIGMDLGENFKSQSIDIDAGKLADGIRDVMSGGKPLLTVEQREATLNKFQKDFKAKQEADMKQKAEKNKQAGIAYLAANKAKPGVVVLPSGLQYTVVEAGTGPMPTDQDVVTVDYEGSLINGTVFDSSYKRGKPVTFTVGEVIPGWKEALKLMKTGSTWMLVVPADLAYGEKGLGAGGPIGPNEVLVFKVKLINIGDAKAVPAADKAKMKQ